MTGRPLRQDVASRTFTTVDGAERFGHLAGEIPDLRIDEPLLPDHEISELGRWWEESLAAPTLSPALVPATPEEARRYWRVTAQSELKAFVAWWARRRPPYTQQDSMRLYRDVADVYAAAVRRRVTVLTGRGVATAPLAHFKRLSLEPLLGLIRDRGVRTVLDFGCGWGANTVILRQLLPDPMAAGCRCLMTPWTSCSPPMSSSRWPGCSHGPWTRSTGWCADSRTTSSRAGGGGAGPTGSGCGAWATRETSRSSRWPAAGGSWTHRPADPGWGRVPGELIVLEKGGPSP